MAYSIYEVDGAQDLCKPSEVMDTPNENVQPDVFYMTRPEVFNFDRVPGEGDPFYKNYLIDEPINRVEDGNNPYYWQ